MGDLLADLRLAVSRQPVMVDHLPFELQPLALAILERRGPARPLPSKRPPLPCGHPIADVAFDAAGVEICRACTGDAAGPTIQKGERIQIGRVAVEVVDVEPGVAVHYRRDGHPDKYAKSWAMFLDWRARG